jgi:hypothetical protein
VGRDLDLKPPSSFFLPPLVDLDLSPPLLLLHLLLLLLFLWV